MYTQNRAAADPNSTVYTKFYGSVYLPYYSLWITHRNQKLLVVQIKWEQHFSRFSSILDEPVVPFYLDCKLHSRAITLIGSIDR